MQITIQIREGPVKDEIEKESEERFLAAQADHLAGARWEEKASACSARNDSGWDQQQKNRGRIGG